MRNAGLAAAASLALAFAASAPGAGTGSRDRLPPITKECIFERSLHDWRPLDRYNLIVYAPSRRHPYHMELDFPCEQLRWADAIAFVSPHPDGRVCGFGGDYILVGDGFVERCPIGAIHKLTPEQAEELVAAFEEAHRSGREP